MHIARVWSVQLQDATKFTAVQDDEWARLVNVRYTIFNLWWRYVRKNIL